MGKLALPVKVKVLFLLNCQVFHTDLFVLQKNLMYLNIKRYNIKCTLQNSGRVIVKRLVLEYLIDFTKIWCVEGAYIKLFVRLKD